MGKSTCSFMGCEKNVLGAGLCSGHYTQQRKGRPLTPIARGLTVEARFWAKVKQSGECWEWTGAVGGHGYGNFGISGDTIRPHRWAYEALRGDIPEGLHLDHLCRNTLCVNPWHLEPVPAAENLRRKPFAHTSIQLICAGGHQMTPENTYNQKKTGLRYCRRCAQRRHSEYRARRRAELAPKQD